MVIRNCVLLLPNNIGDKLVAPKNLVTENLQIVCFVVVN